MSPQLKSLLLHHEIHQSIIFELWLRNWNWNERYQYLKGQCTDVGATAIRNCEAGKMIDVVGTEI
jgi:hypothetical protein